METYEEEKNRLAAKMSRDYKRALILFWLVAFPISCVFSATAHALFPRGLCPKPQVVTFSGMPRAVVEVMGHWKGGPFTIGFRIITDEYVVVSGDGGLSGQENQAFGGPGLVDSELMESFRLVAEVAKHKKDRKPMLFTGELCIAENGQPFLYQNKKVLVLRRVCDDELPYEIKHR